MSAWPQKLSMGSEGSASWTCVTSWKFDVGWRWSSRCKRRRWHACRLDLHPSQTKRTCQPVALWRSGLCFGFRIRRSSVRIPSVSCGDWLLLLYRLFPRTGGAILGSVERLEPQRWLCLIHFTDELRTWLRQLSTIRHCRTTVRQNIQLLWKQTDWFCGRTLSCVWWK